MLIGNHDLGYRGALVVVAVPKGSQWSLTLSDVPSPRFVLVPVPKIDMRASLAEANLRRHELAEEKCARLLEASTRMRPYVPAWRARAASTASGGESIAPSAQRPF